MESSRDNCLDLPEVITPELLLHGYNLLHVNLVPHLEMVPDDPDWNSGDPVDLNPSNVKDIYHKLRKVRANLKKVYHEEYLTKLIDQATDRKGRYVTVKHRGLRMGDIVLLKEENCKPAKYPMAIVLEVQLNSLSESTGAIVKKGNGEIVKRHSSSLIPLLTFGNSSSDEQVSTDRDTDSNPVISNGDDGCRRRRRPMRKAAKIACKKNELLMQ